MTVQITNKNNSYKNRHHEKHNKESKREKYNYSLPCNRWLSVEDLEHEFEYSEEYLKKHKNEVLE